MRTCINQIVLRTVIVGFVIFSACQKADLSEIENLNGNRISIIGHGGIGFPSPENNLPASSFSSVTKAVEGYNANGVEIDVQMSSDGTLFMYHDQKLESQTDCQGCIYFYDSLTLSDCRFRAGFNTNIFLDEYMMPLRSVLERFATRTIKPLVILDVKTSINCQQTFDYNSFEVQLTNSISELLLDFEALEWCIVESGNLGFLKSLQDRLPAVKISYNGVSFPESLAAAIENDFFMLSFSNDKTNRDEVKEAHLNGLRVSLYNVKVRSAAIEAIEKSPDMIYTDNILLLQEILR